MEFKGVELHNVRELIYNEETGGYKLSRMPMRVAEKMSADVCGGSGCEIRFVPLDSDVTIKIKTADNESRNQAPAAVYYGSIQSGWRQEWKRINSEVTEITVPQSPNLDTLKAITDDKGFAFSPEVIRIVLQNCYHYEIIDVIGNCRPPMPSEVPTQKYLAYGSSITHGSLARHISDSYAVRLSENLKCDYLNLGFSGNAKLEAAVADYIADECAFDFATLEMGINVLSIDPEDFRRRVEYFVSRIAKAHPDKKIFCIDVFYMADDVLYGNGEKNKARVFRKIVKETVETLDLPNAIYVSGLDILDGAEWLSEDLVHPNARGVEQLAKNLTSMIKKFI